MGIKIKNKKPTLNEFSSKDLIVNPQENKLFFKGKDKVVEVGSGLPGQWVKRDNNNIFYRSGSAQVLDDGTNNYIIELSAASSGPRINFGDHDSNNDSFMVLGAFSSINQIDTQARDFHLYGTNTTTGFYFDESAGKFGIGTTSPQSALHLASDTADVILTLEADISDDTESHNPAIKLLQDGGNVAGWLGIAGADSQWPDGTTLTGGLSNNLILGTSGSASSDNEQLQFATVNNVRMTITNTGKVGIGTTAPSGFFHINEATGTSQGISGQGSLVLSHDNTGGVSSIVFVSAVNATSDRAYIQYEEDASDFGTTNENGLLTIGVENDSSSTNEDAIKFRVNATDAIVIRGDADVGIGTTDPSTQLHVRDDQNTDTGITVTNNFDNEDAEDAAATAGVFLHASSNNARFRCFGALTDLASDHRVDIGSTASNSFLTLGNSSGTHMCIQNDGHVGIGDAANNSGTGADNLLHVKESLNGYLMLIENGNNDAKGIEIKLTTVQADDNDSEQAATGNNNIFVRCSDGQGSVGSLKAEEGELLINFTSDGRLKQNIRAVQDVGIEDLLKIQVREFTWKKDKSNKKQHGFIAQEVEKIYPYAVDGEGNEDPAEEPMQISKMKFIPLIVKSMQDQQAQIEELKKRIKKLEDKWD